MRQNEGREHKDIRYHLGEDPGSLAERVNDAAELSQCVIPACPDLPGDFQSISPNMRLTNMKRLTVLNLIFNSYFIIFCLGFVLSDFF